MGLTVTITGHDDDGLWHEHLPAWNAWCEVSGQWRTISISSMAGAHVLWLGLDYTAARAGLELAGVIVTPELWNDLRAIETGAIEELNRGRG